MKAITLYQPWATLMAIGVKRNETRPRPWYYLGDVAIHAARLKWDKDVPEYAIPALGVLLKHRNALPGKAENIEEIYKALPFGAVVAVVRKTGCLPTVNASAHRGSEEMILGDYTPGRFYYPTDCCRMLREPVAVNGKQGFWELPPEIESAVRKQVLIL